MFEEYFDERNYIFKLLKDAKGTKDKYKYKTCVSLCESLIDTLNNLDDYDNVDAVHYTFWFCYNYMATCYRELNELSKSIKCLNKSMDYSVTRSHRIQSIWLLGVAHKKIGNTKKALYYYNRCIEHYIAEENTEQLAHVLKNKSRLLNNSDIAKQAIEYFKYINAPAAVIDENYDSLFEIYINKNDYLNACLILNKITDLGLKIKLRQQLSTLVQGDIAVNQ